MTAVRSSYAWKIARKKALRGATHCAICGRLLDFDAPARSKWAPSVDHVHALVVGGDPFAQTNLRPAHVGCNSSLGAVVGNRRRRRRRDVVRAMRPEIEQRARWW